MRLSTVLRRAARAATTAEAVSSGNPRRIVHRARNIAVGRLLGRLGFWRRLWR